MNFNYCPKFNLVFEGEICPNCSRGKSNPNPSKSSGISIDPFGYDITLPNWTRDIGLLCLGMFLGYSLPKLVNIWRK